MTRHQVFLVHGMGDFNDRWSAEIQKLLKEAYESYEGTSHSPFDDLFEFREINYNKFFEERREAWKNKTEEINLLLKSNGFSDKAAEKLMNLAGQTEGDDFFRTHVLDVIMYRYMPQVAEQIRRDIQLQILEALDEFPENQSVKWSIVAHSLGTSVVHDTLHAVFTHRVNDKLLSRSDRLSVLLMVANVSRLLWNDVDFYGTAVRPNPLPSKGICKRYLNAQHALDPFPRVKPFNKPADKWLDENARLEKSYTHIQIPKVEVTDWNVHGFAHYLANPRVHVPLFRSLLFDSAISGSEKTEKQKEYKQSFLSENVTQRVIEELNAVKPGARDDWEQLTESITTFRNIVLGKGIAASEGEGR